MPKIRDVRFMYKEDPNNKRWAEDKSRFGFKLLEKMGWKEGDGLGKKRDGMTEHVKAVWKTDTTGLGAKEETKKKRTVSDKTSSFSDVLNKLKEQYNTVDNVDDNKEKKKKKKKESKKDANNEEETKNEETNEEPKETPVEKKEEEKKEVKRVHHKRRARSKMTKNYSKEDLAAIMGNNPLKLKEEKMMNKDNNNSIRNEEGQRDVNVSSVSTATYFSRKLSEMKLNQPNEVDDEGNEEPTIMEEDAAVIIQKEEVKEESEVVNNEEEEERQRKLEKEERKRKRREKKEKKEKKRKQKEEEEQQE